MNLDVVGYQYVVLRCVARVEREEFVNVGVVLHSQQADFLDAATRVDRRRLAAFAPDLDLDALEAALVAVQAVCRGETGDGRPTLDTLGQRFGWLSAPRSTVIQPSSVHGGLTHDPRAELTRLSDLLAG